MSSKRTVTLTLTKDQWAAMYALLAATEDIIIDEDLDGVGDMIRCEYAKTYPTEHKAFTCH